MKKRDERLKASDIFNQSDFVFSKKVTFKEAFPEIDDINVEVKESGDGTYGDGKSCYGKGHIGEYINCSNRICYNGGFSIREVIRDMVRKEETETKTTKYCQGYEGSPKGRRKYRSCMNNFKIKVSIKYKEKPINSE